MVNTRVVLGSDLPLQIPVDLDVDVLGWCSCSRRSCGVKVGSSFFWSDCLAAAAWPLAKSICFLRFVELILLERDLRVI